MMLAECSFSIQQMYSDSNLSFSFICFVEVWIYFVTEKKYFKGGLYFGYQRKIYARTKKFDV